MPRRQLSPRPASDAEHSVVYRREDAFCGWPFYCGLWRVANGDLLAGFKKVPLAYRDAAEISHDRLTYRQGDLHLIRSSDNGRTWNGDDLTHVHPLDIEADDILARGDRTYRAEGALDFASPDTLIMTGAVPAFLKPDSQPWLRASIDGGRTWRRHILLPMGGFPALSGCGSSLTRGDGVNLIGLAMTTEQGWVNRPLVYASRDGTDWHFLSFITQEDHGTFVSHREGNFIFGAIGRFYPRLIALNDGRILASIRAQRDARGDIWTEIYRSDDGGLTWAFLSRVAEWGAPGDLVQLSDGHVVCVYGYRVGPPGIRARVSADCGATWGDEIVLRDDGGSWDLGYPRIIEHEPNRVLAIYYMNLPGESISVNGGIRHIAQTTFTPD